MRLDILFEVHQMPTELKHASTLYSTMSTRKYNNFWATYFGNGQIGKFASPKHQPRKICKSQNSTNFTSILYVV